MNNVLLLRSIKGKTQDEFAEMCGVSRISIARYETGAEINRANAVKIANACGVSVEYVLGIDDKPTEDEFQDDAIRIRERLRRDPSFRVLFSAAEKVKSEHLEAAAAMLKALGDDD